MKTLAELLRVLPPLDAPAADKFMIRSITVDSRQVEPGALFVAVPGVAMDGRRFIPEALRRGAAAVLAEPGADFPPAEPAGVPMLPVADAREALAWLCAAWNDFPARRMRMIGITGTDGKTTTTNLIYHILALAGEPVSMISTINAHIGAQEFDTGLHTTTPDAPDVQRYLAEMAAAGTRTAILETTSHGLAQHRVTGCEFDVGVVTNITHEHLDYHGTYEAYRDAKALLFRSLSYSWRKAGTSKLAVLNADDSSFGYLRAIPADQQISYAIEAPAEVRAKEIACTASETRCVAVTPWGSFPLHAGLVGRYNVYNMLAAAATTLALGFSPEQVQAGIAAIQQLTGRTEQIDLGQPFTAMVDFAHTPNALRNVLRAVRPLTQGRVLVVFGCAGLRDVQKRPLMGQIAGELADVTILTAEDPRTEDLHAINAEIIEGYRCSGRPLEGHLWQVDDRAEAIRRAINMAEAGDLVLVTGKGHERSLCFGQTETPWSDHQAVIEALRARTF